MPGSSSSPLRRAGQHVQRVLSEVLHELLGRRRADAVHQAGSEVLLNAGDRRRLDDLAGGDLDLLAVDRVLDPVPVYQQMLARSERGQHAYRGRTRLAHAHLKDAVAVFLVAKDGLLHDGLEVLHANPPSETKTPLPHAK